MPLLLPILADALATPAGAVRESPLAILTFIAAPAVLTNAASLLALGTSNRFGRNIDRSRALIRLLEASVAEEERAMYRRLLGWLESRMAMLMSALSMFYFAIGCFAAASVTSLLGAIVAPADHPRILNVLLVAALVAGVSGLIGLVYGGLMLVRETRLALATVREEMRFHRARLDA